MELYESDNSTSYNIYYKETDITIQKFLLSTENKL